MFNRDIITSVCTCTTDRKICECSTRMNNCY